MNIHFLSLLLRLNKLDEMIKDLARRYTCQVIDDRTVAFIVNTDRFRGRIVVDINYIDPALRDVLYAVCTKTMPRPRGGEGGDGELEG